MFLSAWREFLTNKHLLHINVQRHWLSRFRSLLPIGDVVVVVVVVVSGLREQSCDVSFANAQEKTQKDAVCEIAVTPMVATARVRMCSGEGCQHDLQKL